MHGGHCRQRAVGVRHFMEVLAELYKATGAQIRRDGERGFEGPAGGRATRPESGELKQDDVVDAEVVDDQKH